MAQNNLIPVVFSSDDNYAPYLAVIMTSIMENSSANNNYEFIVLETSISDENKERFALLVQDKHNFSVRFINLKHLVTESAFALCKWFSVETYYRLYVPALLSEYNKIIYLDVDMIVLEDVANLYNIDIEEYSIGATVNLGTLRAYREPGEQKEYFENILKLNDPGKYIQAGVLIINLERMRINNEQEQLLELAINNDFELVDQDALNSFYSGNFKFIDQAWDVEFFMVDYEEHYLVKEFGHNEELLDNFRKAKENPKIIHYDGPIKPWHAPEMTLASTWWKYVKPGPFYQVIMDLNAQKRLEYLSKLMDKLKDLYDMVQYLDDERNDLANKHYGLSLRLDDLSWHRDRMINDVESLSKYHSDLSDDHYELRSQHSFIAQEHISLYSKHNSLLEQYYDLLAKYNALTVQFDEFSHKYHVETRPMLQKIVQKISSRLPEGRMKNFINSLSKAKHK